MYVCVCMYVSIYVYVCVIMYVCMYMYVCVQVCIYVYICTYIRTYVHTYVCISFLFIRKHKSDLIRINVRPDRSLGNEKKSLKCCVRPLLTTHPHWLSAWVRAQLNDDTELIPIQSVSHARAWPHVRRLNTTHTTTISS